MIAPTSNHHAQNGRLERSPPGLSRFEQQLRVLDVTVDLLIARTNMGDYWPEGFQDAGRCLGAMPLPSADFASANLHLKNAAAYCEQIEFGAAAFELRSLRGQLQRL